MGKIERAERTRVDDDTLRQFLGYNLKRLFNVVNADLARTLEPFELRMLTYTALVLIRDNSGLKQSDLARAMDVERSNMVAILDELERLCLIRRESVPRDRRSHALVVTETGTRTCDRAVAAVLAHEAELFAALPTDAQIALQTLLSNAHDVAMQGGQN